MIPETILSLGMKETVAAQRAVEKQERIIKEMHALLRELKDALAVTGKLIG